MHLSVDRLELGVARAFCLVLLLAGCTGVHLTQPPGMAIVRTGRLDIQADHGPIAARVLPYALLAEQTYHPTTYQNKQAAEIRHCETAEPNCADEQSKRILQEWRLVWAEADRFLECSPGAKSCRPRLPGLGVQIWVMRGTVCREAVIAFRGTQRRQLGNWVSNLHWISRHLPVSDQYHQVRRNIDWLVARIKQEPCYRDRVTKITAVGHSLGAGLAQHATYKNGEIRRVYGFDPTFVTGSLDPGLPDRNKHAEGLIIERVYEHGEILAYPRFVMRHLFPPPDCNPRIVTIRFDVIKGSFVDQHSLYAFNTKLLKESQGRLPERNPVAEQGCVETG